MAAPIFVSLMDESQDYHQQQAAAAREAAARAGIGVDVVFAENNAIVQIHQVFSRLHAPEEERPRVIVVQSITGEGLERVARNAANAGIGWILLNRRGDYIDELRGRRPDLPITSVSPDQEAIGRIQGRQARILAPDGGMLIYLQGPADSSAACDRLRGTEEVLKNALFEWKTLTSDWTEAGGEAAVAAWLRLKTSGGRKPALMIAQNDAMAVGGQRALVSAEPEWGSIPVVGCDGLREHGQRLVERGELAATVVLPLTAGQAVDVAAAWIRSSAVPAARVVLAPTPLPSDDALRRSSGAFRNALPGRESSAADNR